MSFLLERGGWLTRWDVLEGSPGYSTRRTDRDSEVLSGASLFVHVLSDFRIRGSQIFRPQIP